MVCALALLVGCGGGVTAGDGGMGGSIGPAPCVGIDCTSANDCVQDGMCDPDTNECMPGDNVVEGESCDLLGEGDGVNDVDLTAYAGEAVRIGVVHATNDYTDTVAAGWYIDDVAIMKF